jgi:hypothetical protein
LAAVGVDVGPDGKSWRRQGLGCKTERQNDKGRGGGHREEDERRASSCHPLEVPVPEEGAVGAILGKQVYRVSRGRSDCRISGAARHRDAQQAPATTYTVPLPVVYTNLRIEGSLHSEGGLGEAPGLGEHDQGRRQLVGHVSRVIHAGVRVATRPRGSAGTQQRVFERLARVGRRT